MSDFLLLPILAVCHPNNAYNKRKRVYIDDHSKIAVLIYRPPKYPLLNRQTMSIYVSGLNSHCAVTM